MCEGFFFVAKCSMCSSFSGAGSHTGMFAPEGKSQDFSNRHTRASLDCDLDFGSSSFRDGVSYTYVDHGKRQTLGLYAGPSLLTLS